MMSERLKKSQPHTSCECEDTAVVGAGVSVSSEIQRQARVAQPLPLHATVCSLELLLSLLPLHAAAAGSHFNERL